MPGAGDRGVKLTNPVRRCDERGEQRLRRKKITGLLTFCPATGPVGYNREQIIGKKAEKIRQGRGVGRPWRLGLPWESVGSVLCHINDFPISLDKCRHGLAEWCRRNAGPARSNCARIAEGFPAGGWKVGRVRRCPRMTGFQGETLYYETNPISENKSHIKALRATWADKARR